MSALSMTNYACINICAYFNHNQTANEHAEFQLYIPVI